MTQIAARPRIHRKLINYVAAVLLMTVCLCQTALGKDLDSLAIAQVTPILSISISASTNAWNRDKLDIQASYRTLSYDFANHDLGYQQHSRSFTIPSPVSAFDFSAAIRAETERSPQKVLSDMIIDGAVGVNLYW